MRIQLAATAGSLVLLLQGCASSQPSRDDAIGAADSGKCIELEDDETFKRLSATSYHTTWWSALAEGAAAGIQDGLSKSGAGLETSAELMANKVETSGGSLNSDAVFKLRPYCRAFASDRRTIAELIPELLKELNFTLAEANVDQGVFVTQYRRREGWGDKWMENIVVTVEEERTNRIVVRVLRNVHISRSDSPFHQARSDGNYETRVLLEIENSLNPAYRH